LSDVDDTLYCSGSSFPAGIDGTYPKRVVYPGCLRLFEAIDSDTIGRMHAARCIPICNMVFLSARPHIYQDVAEKHSYGLFQRLHSKGLMHGYATLLPGYLRQSVLAMFKTVCYKNRAWGGVGELKFSTFRRFRRLYPEYDYVFFGDNGQGDLLCAHRICDADSKQSWHEDTHRRVQSCLTLETQEDEAQRTATSDSTLESEILGCFIHSVLAEEDAPLCLPSHETDITANGMVMFYKSYIGAALALCRKHPQVISLHQVREIGIAAMMEYRSLLVTYEEWDKDARGPAQSDLQADLEALNQELENAGMDKLSHEFIYEIGVTPSGYLGGLVPDTQIAPGL